MAISPVSAEQQWLHWKEGKDVAMQEMVKKALMPEKNVEMQTSRK